MTGPDAESGVGPDTEAGPEELRVTTLEAFFDLVFVFAITQLTTVLVDEPTGVGLARMALLLAVTWWMYGGYAWLTNVVPPVRTGPRLLLIAAMAGFLVTALAAPTAFGSGALAFAIGYLVVVSVHAGLFLTSTSRRAMLRVAPWNVGAALLLVVAAFVPGPVRWGLWVLVPAALWLFSHLSGPDTFDLRPGHFVERHGLVLLIAFGESVAAIGVGIAGPGTRLSGGLVLAAVLTLVVLAGLWWSYFGGADALAERRLRAAPPRERARLALAGYGRAFYLLLAGVIVLAAGVKRAIGHPWDAGNVLAAAAIGGGVALYLVGDAALRGTLRLGPVGPRLVALGLALAGIALGAAVSVIAQLGLVAAVLAGTFAVEHRRG